MSAGWVILLVIVVPPVAAFVQATLEALFAPPIRLGDDLEAELERLAGLPRERQVIETRQDLRIAHQVRT